MKIRVRYRQKYSMGLHTLVRIIDLQPDNLIFKNRVKQNIVNSMGISIEEYMSHVERILNYSEEELIEKIQPIINKHLILPDKLSKKIMDYDIELDV